jgi:hydrogenase expression/formation protein HypE
MILGECPLPLRDYDRVLLAHGNGGKLTHDLVERLFVPEFNNAMLRQLHDGAVLQVGDSRLAFSTDSYVVDPLFFPGGDIGELAVNGTVNDIAVCGARPLYLSVGLIIEEGLPMEDLRRIVRSMKNAAARAGVLLITGDTKVVDRGKGDKIFINTSGIGVIDEGIEILPTRISPGDKILLSGTIGDHGMTILSEREGLRFQSELRSDTAPLNGLVDGLLRSGGKEIHFLRDITRGGLATVLNEIASSSSRGITVTEEKIPVNLVVRSACEILGLDPLYVANEGKLVAIVDPPVADRLLKVMKRDPLGRNAAIIGEVVEAHPGRVFMRTTMGTSRIVDLLAAEQLPRIC